jgi:hypothetical protein
LASAGRVQQEIVPTLAKDLGTDEGATELIKAIGIETTKLSAICGT